MVNPYAVWNTTQSNEMAPHRGSSQPVPSIYGALPFPSQLADNPPLMVFTFTGFNPTIANCTILGPNGSPQFGVVTEPALPGYTILKSMNGKSVALIEWREPAKVEIRGLAPKQPVSSFLKVSSDGRYRIMVVGSQEFMWLPDHSASISLYTANPSGNSEFWGRMSRSVGAITLEMTQNAVRVGLLQACIISTVLLQSGRNID